MNNRISPKYKMKLLTEVENAIWKEYESYKKVRQYMVQWIEEDGWNNQNFAIITKGDTEDIDLTQTLTHIDDETLLKIAVDIGVNTPNFIPVIAEIENVFKNNYQTSLETFQAAQKQIYENPDSAISLANSGLESIIKQILKDARFAEFDKTKTLYDQASDILKYFKIYPKDELPIEIKTIGSSLLAVARAIEQLRSEKTKSHGKTIDEYIVNDSLYASFIVNTVATLGIFFKNYYEKRYLPLKQGKVVDTIDDLPF